MARRLFWNKKNFAQNEKLLIYITNRTLLEKLYFPIDLVNFRELRGDWYLDQRSFKNLPFVDFSKKMWWAFCWCNQLSSSFCDPTLKMFSSPRHAVEERKLPANSPYLLCFLTRHLSSFFGHSCSLTVHTRRFARKIVGVYFCQKSCIV